MITLTTDRLTIREAAPDDLPGLLPVYLSNPDLVMANEGSQGEPGHYDLDMFERDWWIASLTPGRHMLGVYLLATGAPIGLADYLEENPDDGLPWLGQLMIHRGEQRQGYGAEAFRALMAYFRAEYGWATVRAGVARQNVVALTFCERMGLRPIAPVRPDAPAMDGRDKATQRFVALAYALAG